MKIPMTEYLRINLETEKWECRVCDHVIAPAEGNYKEGCWSTTATRKRSTRQ